MTGDRAELAAELARVGRAVRAAVGPAVRPGDDDVVRHEGGDEVFGVDARADAALVDALRPLGARWPGRLVMEGVDDPVPIGDPDGPWTYLADPVDGSRGWFAGKASAWVLLGAGRDVRTLEDLEVGAAVELPTAGHTRSRVAWAAAGEGVQAVDEDAAGRSVPVELRPRRGDRVDRTFVTVMRFAPGPTAPIARWADEHLAGLTVYEDTLPCTGRQLMGLAAGSDAAVLDPRPLLTPHAHPAHPYDLAALVVAREAGVIVEALPPGPLLVPADLETAVAWAGYANDAVARRLRPAAESFRGG